MLKGISVMFLAIKGSVDAVFKLQKPDVPTIEKYLFDIPHEIFRTKKRHINKVYKKKYRLPKQ